VYCAALRSTSIDYFWVEVKNVITDFPEEEIFANYPRWASTRVVRRPPDAQYPNLPGTIDYLILNFVNVGKLQTSGVDANIEYRAPPTSLGQFTFALNGTYVFDYKQTSFDGTQLVSYAGKRGVLDGAIARWRHYAQLNWTKGPWGATLANTYQTGYSEPDLTTCDDEGLNCAGNRRVGSYSIWDLQGRYTGFQALTLTLGIRNLADTRPPVSNQSFDFQVGYDPSYADPRGRTYYAAIRYAFK